MFICGFIKRSVVKNSVVIVLLSSITNSIFASSATAAKSNEHNHAQMTGHQQSNYAGQQNRTIKSLSTNDIKQLQMGKGWGLAKAAELNGVPGPAHLLDMSQQINLSAEQQQKIKKVYLTMKSNAIRLGKQLIKSEQQLNIMFANNTVDENLLSTILAEIAGLRQKLRYEHLFAHLKMPMILSKQQITQYNVLRGYSTQE